MSFSSRRSVRWVSFASIILPSLATTQGTYHLEETFKGRNILNHFHVYEGSDPTNGFVTYVNQSYAEDSGLIDITSSGGLYMGVDHTTVLNVDGPGRDSVRIETKDYYEQGLYIIDIQHMPGSICGTWPAFWSVGPNWPNDGEIDIIEGVNKNEANEIVLHTSGSCDVGGNNDMSGNITSTECGEASGTIGCVVDGAQGSFGTPFNSQNGGVYAMEWASDFIKIWFFPRSSIPASITKESPNTTEFGTPMAHLEGTCDFSQRFSSQKFILDTTFCGDWAGNVFGKSECPMSDSSSPMKSCVNYVAENPAVFKESYWEINSFNVYKTGASSTSSSSSATSPTTRTATLESTTTTSTVAKPETSVTTATVSRHSSVPSTAEPEDSEPVSTMTSYVTLTTKLCPLSQSRLQVPTAQAVSHAAESSSVSLSSQSKSAVSAGSLSSPTPSFVIVPSSTQFISLPAVTTSSSSGTVDDLPTGTQSEASATVPTSPVFTGAAGKLSFSAAGIVGGIVVALLASLS
ncbi:hypothetical protein AOCH_005856 [Aspergillus ochraceoroseus]|uniref:endo-1,3(4)-beta-glucanase n=2 Tax=Aspergillus ochraceoroseus TaxID=138278 RepID=A0A0F8WEZ5_9EURO|nr:hypothetical protein AOCH_005856 [Aspergillus ochraceoroseus]